MKMVKYYVLFLLQEGESAVEFANRVKSAMADQTGLLDLEW